MQITIEMTNAKQENTILPHAYQHLIQGMLFDIWKDDSDFSAKLHAYDNDNGRIFRGFTFGALLGRFVSEERSIIYTTPISLTVRALNPILIEKLVLGIQKEKYRYIGSNLMEVTSSGVSDVHIETCKTDVRMLTPITVYHTDERNQTKFYRPDEGAFYDGIARNAVHKFQYYTEKEYVDSFSIIPKFNGLPKRMFTVYKGSYITAWYGQYELSGSPEILDILYQTGIGGKNSQGFGMFDTIDGGVLEI